MAYITDQEDEDQVAAEGEESAPTTSSSSSVVTPQSASEIAASKSTTPSAPYVNIEDYLNANQGTADVAKSAVTSEAQKVADTEKADIESQSATAQESASTAADTINKYLDAGNVSKDITQGVQKYQQKTGDLSGFNPLSSVLNYDASALTAPTLSHTGNFATAQATFSDPGAIQTKLSDLGYGLNDPIYGKLNQHFFGAGAERGRQEGASTISALDQYLADKQGAVSTAYSPLATNLQTAQANIRTGLGQAKDLYKSQYQAKLDEANKGRTGQSAYYDTTTTYHPEKSGWQNVVSEGGEAQWQNTITPAYTESSTVKTPGTASPYTQAAPSSTNFGSYYGGANDLANAFNAINSYLGGPEAAIQMNTQNKLAPRKNKYTVGGR